MNGSLQIFSGVLHCHKTHRRCHSPAVSSPEAWLWIRRVSGLGWICSERRGRTMCPTLKRNPGKEDRKAPSQASRCSTEIKLLPCNGSSSQRHQADP